MTNKTPRWAIAVGVISIVFASLGLICTPISLAMPWPPDFDHIFPPWFQTFSVFAGLLGIAEAVLLMAAGISLLCRRPVAASLHMVYAWIVVLTGMLGIAVVLAALDSTWLPGLTTAGLMGGMCGGLLGLGYPIFLLIWFSRTKIRREVLAWGQFG